VRFRCKEGNFSRFTSWLTKDRFIRETLRARLSRSTCWPAFSARLILSMPANIGLYDDSVKYLPTGSIFNNTVRSYPFTSRCFVEGPQKETESGSREWMRGPRESRFEEDCQLV
jgi:hypothetical protein